MHVARRKEKKPYTGVTYTSIPNPIDNKNKNERKVAIKEGYTNNRGNKKREE